LLVSNRLRCFEDVAGILMNTQRSNIDSSMCAWKLAHDNHEQPKKNEKIHHPWWGIEKGEWITFEIMGTGRRSTIEK
jgi:hypothetical protein